MEVSIGSAQVMKVLLVSTGKMYVNQKKYLFKNKNKTKRGLNFMAEAFKGSWTAACISACCYYDVLFLDYQPPYRRDRLEVKDRRGRERVCCFPKMHFFLKSHSLLAVR